MTSKAFQGMTLAPLLPSNLLIGGSFPLAGFIKINTDGNAKGNPGSTGFGAIARDEIGNWLWSAYGHIDTYNSIMDELWVMREALDLASKRNTELAIVESDCKPVVTLLLNLEEDHTHCDTLRCRGLREWLLGLEKIGSLSMSRTQLESQDGISEYCHCECLPLLSSAITVLSVIKIEGDDGRRIGSR
ncbi:hypothetical protein F0562_022557 [Nyssa sinensis]|uniref:RNase H type-1 domain-containing protein n=1 Tax=Nyssa sinensis TaxID=561372 RepID=A0A5J5BPM1_9ASTE|nr:hypothetical protein F0562_022557 [Nyssa sinensis]